MEPITVLLLGGLGAYAWEKNQNPRFSLLSWLAATPESKHEALEKVKVTSVPTPSPTTALDPGMSTDQVHQVNTALLTETSPKKLLGHAEALKDLGHASSAAALVAKASAVGEAKTKGASEAEVQGKQAQAAAAAPSSAGASAALVTMGACEAQTLLNAILMSRGMSDVDGVPVPIAISGVWDAETAHLLHVFQAEHGLLATGEADDATAAALRSYFHQAPAGAAGGEMVGWSGGFSAQQQQQNCQSRGGTWTGSSCQYPGHPSSPTGGSSGQPCSLGGGKIQGYRDASGRCVYPSLGGAQQSQQYGVPQQQYGAAPYYRGTQQPYGGMPYTRGVSTGPCTLGGGAIQGYRDPTTGQCVYPSLQQQQPMMPPDYMQMPMQQPIYVEPWHHHHHHDEDQDWDGMQPQPQPMPMPMQPGGITVTPGNVMAGEWDEGDLVGLASYSGGGLVSEFKGGPGQVSYGGGGLVAEFPTGAAEMDPGLSAWAGLPYAGDWGGGYGGWPTYGGGWGSGGWPTPGYGGGWGGGGWGGGWPARRRWGGW